MPRVKFYNTKTGKWEYADASVGSGASAGYTLTEEDKAEIVAAVIESLGGNPVFGYVDGDNNIYVSGNLPDGTYTVKYEMEDGSTVNIGSLVLDSNVYYSVTNTLTNCVSSNSATQAAQGESYSATISANSGYELSSVVVTMGGTDITASAVSGGAITIANVTGDIVITAAAAETAAAYTNQIPVSIDSDGTLYNGGQGWKTGYRISGSSGAESTAADVEVTGFIPYTKDDAVYCKGITDAGTHVIGFYDADFAYINGYAASQFGTLDGSYIQLDTAGVLYGNVTVEKQENIRYIRISADVIDDNSVVTVNEPME